MNEKVLCFILGIIVGVLVGGGITFVKFRKKYNELATDFLNFWHLTLMD